MSEPVSVTIIEKEVWTYMRSTLYEVVVKVTPEFMREPKEVVSDEEKAEYISQRIKEEFYKILMKK